ncbi:MAG: hypothetical protein ABII25_08050, partial [bacterium]
MAKTTIFLLLILTLLVGCGSLLSSKQYHVALLRRQSVAAKAQQKAHLTMLPGKECLSQAKQQQDGYSYRHFFAPLSEELFKKCKKNWISGPVFYNFNYERYLQKYYQTLPLQERIISALRSLQRQDEQIGNVLTELSGKYLRHIVITDELPKNSMGRAVLGLGVVLINEKIPREEKNIDFIVSYVCVHEMFHFAYSDKEELFIHEKSLKVMAPLQHLNQAGYNMARFIVDLSKAKTDYGKRAKEYLIEKDSTVQMPMRTAMRLLREVLRVEGGECVYKGHEYREDIKDSNDYAWVIHFMVKGEKYDVFMNSSFTRRVLQHLSSRLSLQNMGKNGDGPDLSSSPAKILAVEFSVWPHAPPVFVSLFHNSRADPAVFARADPAVFARADPAVFDPAVFVESVNLFTEYIALAGLIRAGTERGEIFKIYLFAGIVLAAILSDQISKFFLRSFYPQIIFECKTTNNSEHAEHVAFPINGVSGVVFTGSHNNPRIINPLITYAVISGQEIRGVLSGSLVASSESSGDTILNSSPLVKSMEDEDGFSLFLMFLIDPLYYSASPARVAVTDIMKMIFKTRWTAKGINTINGEGVEDVLYFVLFIDAGGQAASVYLTVSRWVNRISWDFIVIFISLISAPISVILPSISFILPVILVNFKFISVISSFCLPNSVNNMLNLPLRSCCPSDNNLIPPYTFSRITANSLSLENFGDFLRVFALGFLSFMADTILSQKEKVVKDNFVAPLYSTGSSSPALDLSPKIQGQPLKCKMIFGLVNVNSSPVILEDFIKAFNKIYEYCILNSIDIRDSYMDIVYEFRGDKDGLNQIQIFKEKYSGFIDSIEDYMLVGVCEILFDSQGNVWELFGDSMVGKTTFAVILAEEYKLLWGSSGGDIVREFRIGNELFAGSAYLSKSKVLLRGANGKNNVSRNIKSVCTKVGKVKVIINLKRSPDVTELNIKQSSFEGTIIFEVFLPKIHQILPSSGGFLVYADIFWTINKELQKIDSPLLAEKSVSSSSTRQEKLCDVEGKDFFKGRGQVCNLDKGYLKSRYANSDFFKSYFFEITGSDLPFRKYGGISSHIPQWMSDPVISVISSPLSSIAEKIRDVRFVRAFVLDSISFRFCSTFRYRVASNFNIVRVLPDLNNIFARLLNSETFESAALARAVFKGADIAIDNLFKDMRQRFPDEKLDYESMKCFLNQNMKDAYLQGREVTLSGIKAFDGDRTRSWEKIKTEIDNNIKFCNNDGKNIKGVIIYGSWGRGVSVDLSDVDTIIIFAEQVEGSNGQRQGQPLK